LSLTILLIAESLQTTSGPKKASKPLETGIRPLPKTGIRPLPKAEIRTLPILNVKNNIRAPPKSTRTKEGPEILHSDPPCRGLFCPSEDKLTKEEIKQAEVFKKEVLPLLPEARKMLIGEGLKANKDIVSPALVHSRQYKRMLKKFKTHEAIVKHFRTAWKFYKLTTKIESGYLPTDKEKQTYIDSMPKRIQVMYNNATDKVKDTIWAAQMLKLSKAYKPIRAAIKEKKQEVAKDAFDITKMAKYLPDILRQKVKEMNKTEKAAYWHNYRQRFDENIEEIEGHFKALRDFDPILIKINEEGYHPTEKERQLWIKGLPKKRQAQYNEAEKLKQDLLWQRMLTGPHLRYRDKEEPLVRNVDSAEYYAPGPPSQPVKRRPRRRSE